MPAVSSQTNRRNSVGAIADSNRTPSSPPLERHRAPSVHRVAPSNTVIAGAPSRASIATAPSLATTRSPSIGSPQYATSMSASPSTDATVSRSGRSMTSHESTPSGTPGSERALRSSAARSAESTITTTRASPRAVRVRRSRFSYVAGVNTDAPAGSGSASGSGTPSAGASHGDVASAFGASGRGGSAAPRTRIGARTCARCGNRDALSGVGRSTASVGQSGTYGATVSGSTSRYSISRSLIDKSVRFGG